MALNSERDAADREPGAGADAGPERDTAERRRGGADAAAGPLDGAPRDEPGQEQAGLDNEPEPVQMGSRASRVADDISDPASVFSNDSDTTRMWYRRLGYDIKTPRQLLRPPPKHPVSGHINTYNPTTDDVDGEFPVRVLLDRRGKASKAAYLIEWDTEKCMPSWVWESKLVDCGAEIEVVNDYKASRTSGASKSSVTLSSFSKRYRGATAFASGRCFFEAI
ncbi:hypothetical protein PF005_g14838 [Phytophthora fragariae]|uniref:Chromo domain-containing protein n=1 Tax=Phytophthora fragariae TaxID=53985 RepID=A0A6A3QGK9_9STRA|nr:hypothetical protein PF003_g40321 [Phytophthora fragariae]KAE8934832.1 hypothetical protein PF009_g15196 [Phytophthora fragariae]KAE8997021.1 hypothetical protein PF011_g15667 [Phytophthora fragariae]KAE9068576.1 hypothetical protein PF010_g27009 [Phytophthora fragariae]KAE9075175.1 hypothetical protein PF007_g25107 [Phytophthora fragariae]